MVRTRIYLTEMKTRFFNLLIIFIFLSLPHILLAGAIDNNNNHSAEYARMGARQGSADSLDSVVYNPAGTVNISDGMHAALNDQIVIYSMGHEAGGKEYEASGSSAVYPSFFLLYGLGDISVYLGFTVAGGIGDVNYNDGIYLTAAAGDLNKDIKASSAYYCGIIGAAYAVSDIISFSLGARGIYSYYEVSAGPDSALLEYKDSAKGIAPVFGINISPFKKLNIGIRYEAEVNLEFNVDKNDSTRIASSYYPEEGSAFRRDLPAMLCSGITYMMIKNSLKLAGDFDYTLNKNARWTENIRNGADEDKYNNSYEVRIGAEYALTNMIKASAGLHHGNPGADKDSYPILGPKMPFNGISLGAMMEPLQDLYINAGISRFFYDDVKNNDGIKIKKKIWLIAVGVQSRVF
jgi:long-chain fatty acid transport protein